MKKCGFIVMITMVVCGIAGATNYVGTGYYQWATVVSPYFSPLVI